MKVVISGYVGKKITGIGRNLLSLLNNVDNGNEYIVYTNYDMVGEMSINRQNVKIKTYGISKMSSIGNLLWTTFIFPLVVLKEKADRALIPNFTLLLFKYKPTIVIIHDLIEFNVKNKFSKKKMFYRTKIADPIMARRADSIITVSENSKMDIMKFLGTSENKINVIYNGVDTEKFHNVGAEQYYSILENKKWPTKFLLYAGTIDHPGKNAMAVIKSFERLRDQKEYDGCLILAGMPGAGFEIVEDYVCNSKYRENIVMTGFVTDEELVALYSACDVFCFVSLYEGFGIPPLEALSCGAKVIVSNTSSLPEVVGKVGYLADPCSDDDIFDTIKRAINEDKISDDEVKKHLASFEWKKLANKFEEVVCGKI